MENKKIIRHSPRCKRAFSWLDTSVCEACRELERLSRERRMYQRLNSVHSNLECNKLNETARGLK